MLFLSRKLLMMALLTLVCLETKCQIGSTKSGGLKGPVKSVALAFDLDFTKISYTDEYDQNGRKIASLGYLSYPDSIRMSMEYTYDDNGRLQEEKRIRDGKTDWLTTYIYSEDKIIKKTLTISRSSTSILEIELDSLDRQISERKEDYLRKVEFDSDGLLTLIEVSGGGYSCIISQTHSVIERDKYGNWVKIETQSTNCSGQTRSDTRKMSRNITYWE